MFGSSGYRTRIFLFENHWCVASEYRASCHKRRGSLAVQVARRVDAGLRLGRMARATRRERVPSIAPEDGDDDVSSPTLADTPIATPSERADVTTSSRRPCHVAFAAILLGLVMGGFVSASVSRYGKSVAAAAKNSNALQWTKRELVTSSNADDRSYEWITMQNGLQALLVCDPDA